MRRYVWTLMVPMFLGCSGANVVSGDDKTDAEKLAADLPSWCEKTCARLERCDANEPQDCGCSGDVCDCTGGGVDVDDDCVEDCEESLADYAKSTEACAGVGRRFQSCIDTLSCDDLNGDSPPACLPSSSEQEACEVDDGGDGGDIDVPPSDGTGGTYNGPTPSYGGTTSYAGSASEGGYGGTGTGAVGPVGPVVTCEVGSGASSGAAGSANMPSGAYVTCEETRAECSDGHEYSWVCVDDGAGRNWCSCFLDNNPVGALPSTGTCPSVALVNSGCGWNLSNNL